VTEALISLSGLFDVLPDAVVVVDGGGRIVLVNPAVERLLGFAPDELIGRPLTILIPDRFRAHHEDHVRQFRASGAPTAMGTRPVIQALHRSGTEVPVSIALANFAAGDEKYSVAVLRDATSVHDHLRAAMSQAEMDSLTHIGNRRYLSRRLQAAIESDRPFGVLFLDLTRFKPFNDIHGHRVGDEVLRMVARRLLATTRDEDALARVGGDEFVIMLDGLADAPALRARASSIQSHLAEPFHVERRIVEVGINVGGALFPDDGRTEEELLAIADRNMYEAKRAGMLFWIHGEEGCVLDST